MAKRKWNPVYLPDGSFFTGWWGEIRQSTEIIETDQEHKTQRLRLRYECMSRGRSACRFTFVSVDGLEYNVSPSGMAVLVHGLACGKLQGDAKGFIDCDWEQVKQGQNYSIEPTWSE